MQKLILFVFFLITSGSLVQHSLQASSLRIQIIVEEERSIGDDQENEVSNGKQSNSLLTIPDRVFGEDGEVKGSIRRVPSIKQLGKDSDSLSFKSSPLQDEGLAVLGNLESLASSLHKCLVDYLGRTGLIIADSDIDLQIVLTIKKIGPVCPSRYPAITAIVYSALQDKEEVFSGSFEQDYDCRFHLNPFYSAKTERQIARILGKDIIAKISRLGTR